MNIAPAVFSLLSNDATLTGLVSNRIYPDQVPQNKTYPAVVHYKTDVNQLAVKSAPTINYRITLQIDIYANQFRQGEQIAAAIKSVLDEYRGTVAGINIQSCYYNTQDDEKFISEVEAYVTTQAYLFRVIANN